MNVSQGLNVKNGHLQPSVKSWKWTGGHGTTGVVSISKSLWKKEKVQGRDMIQK